MVTISEGDGAYKFLESSIGTYRLSYDLAGFATLVREEIRLTIDFAARVDVVMQLSGVNETVTVRGASPLVDVSHTSGGTTITQEVLSQVPTNLSLTNAYDLAAALCLHLAA